MKTTLVEALAKDLSSPLKSLEVGVFGAGQSNAGSVSSVDVADVLNQNQSVASFSVVDAPATSQSIAIPVNPPLASEATRPFFLGNLTVEFGNVFLPDANVNGLQGTVSLRITNNGRSAITGPVTINLYASADDVLDVRVNPVPGSTDPVANVGFGRDALLTTVTPSILGNIGAGETRTINVNYNQIVVGSPGAFYLIAEVDPNNTIAERNESDNLGTTAVSLPGTNVVLDWAAVTNNVVQEARILETAPPYQTRNHAIIQSAVFDAVNLIETAQGNAQYSSIFVDSLPPGLSAIAANASAEAAAAQAAFTALTAIYTDARDRLESVGDTAGVDRVNDVLGDLREQLTRSLAEIPDGAAERNGRLIGRFVASQILAGRENDGATEAQFDIPLNDIPFDSTEYIWRPDPTSSLFNNGEGLLPGWGNVTPFGIDSLAQFLPEAYPEFGSLQYALEIEEVRRFGGRSDTATTSLLRTADQTELAFFWREDEADTERPPGQYFRIAQEILLNEGSSLLDSARTLALVSIAQANAGIVAWEAKWNPPDGLAPQPRPGSVINFIAAADGVAATIADPDWQPLFDNPPFPDYISGHATFGGAAFGVLERIFGENYVFSSTSQDLIGVTRSWTSFDQAALENALSRVYGGVHVRSAGLLGVESGAEIANFVFDNLATALA